MIGVVDLPSLFPLWNRGLNINIMYIVKLELGETVHSVTISFIPVLLPLCLILYKLRKLVLSGNT